MLSLCYEQNSSNCLSECGRSVYYNLKFNVLSNAVDFIALTPLMIRAGIQDGGLWIQCTVYVVKNILNFAKVISVLIKSNNSFSYILMQFIQRLSQIEVTINIVIVLIMFKKLLPYQYILNLKICFIYIAL